MNFSVLSANILVSNLINKMSEILMIVGEVKLRTDIVKRVRIARCKMSTCNAMRMTAPRVELFQDALASKGLVKIKTE